MGAVVLSSLKSHKEILPAALLNIVIAANAGGAFSPFGDITTLMIWQKGMLEFGQFFALFVPALVNWLVPAAILSLSFSSRKPEGCGAPAAVRKGGLVVVGLFAGTIASTILLNHFLDLPAFLGMMMGLGALSLYGYFLQGTEMRTVNNTPLPAIVHNGHTSPEVCTPFDIFGVLKKTEWDTLLFFYGVMMCIGGLGAMGHLDALSKLLYTDLGSTAANVAIGFLSAIIDNIPLTYAVLSMNPPMGDGEWLLLALTAGVGGSILSIGSAAGVALMGVKESGYTFLSHFKWTWAILLGYAASIGAHLWLNGPLR
jgi:Na+/H+ antiporter NhaD/arsenite permease-like protein